MNKPVVFMFSGQGSHYQGMGKELYQTSQRFKYWMDHCDKVSRDVGGISFIETFYGGGIGASNIDRPAFSGVGLISIQYSLSKLLMEKGIYPDALLGYSLGETTSAIVAGAISLEEGLDFAVRHSRLLENESQPARLIAVIDDLGTYQSRKDIYDGCWLTAANFSRNFVVGGDLQSMQRVEAGLKNNGVVHQILPTTIGYHTPLIDELEIKFKKIMDRYRWAPTRINMISSQDGSTRVETSAEHLWNVIRQPVEFLQTIRNTMSTPGGHFIDVGPSGSLATYVKYNGEKGGPIHSYELMNRFGKNIYTFDRFILQYQSATGSLA